MRSSRRTVSEWAVAGLLIPVLGGATAGAVPRAADHGSLVGVTAPASVTLVPEEQLAEPVRDQARVTAAAVVAATPVNLPALLWQAYAAAADGAPAGCHLPMSLLAAIGQVESGSLAGRGLDAAHRVVPAVLGPVLDGDGFAAITDTDGGELDGDRHWDRAVGPMQFIPSTWARWGRDGDGDGTADPQDIEDAAAAAAAYLCAGGRDLATTEGLRDAILSYNHSIAYLTLVLRWKQAFEAIPPETGPIETVASAPVAVPAVAPAVAPAVVPAVAVPAPPEEAAAPEAAPPAPAALVEPTAAPTGEPSPEPTPEPTQAPAPGPTAAPAPEPTAGSTAGPTPEPAPGPTCPAPTSDPTSTDPTPEPVDVTPTATPSEPPDPCAVPDETPTSAS